MTSDTRERSWADGAPLMLIDFVRGTQHWRYTTSDRPETHLGFVFEPTQVTRSRIEQGPERRRLTLTITLPETLSLLDNWRPYPTVDTVGVTVLVKHRGEADALVDWVGRVVAPRFRTDGLVELVCEPTQTSARRIGLRRCWQRGCPLALYSAGTGQCNVSRDAHRITATITDVIGVSIEATAFALLPSGRLAGGYIEWVRPNGVVETRSIRMHSGPGITLDYGSEDLATGLVLSAYPGCKHTTDDCAGYFNNIDNYGGEPWMPNRSPFDGNPVY